MATVTFKCPNCGGDLQFDPDSQKFKCEYCESEFEKTEIEKLNIKIKEKVAEKTAAEETDTAGTDEAAVIYTCPSCGAEIVTDETTAATFCYYCHNPVVLSGKLDGAYTPDYVIPFKIDREKASTIFVNWIGKKKFVPKSFFSEEQIKSMTGVYFPYLLYSCKIDGKIDVQAIKVKTWRSGNVEYTERGSYNVIRDGSMNVENVTRNALKKANKQLVEGVLPYDMKEMQSFNMGYLSGFQAEKRDMNKEEFETDVNNEVSDYAMSQLSASMAGYTNYNITKDNTKIASSEWKYALLPVWTVTYNDKSKNKIYYFSLNGQSGKICGELPVDTGKLVKMFLGIFAPMMAVLLIVGYFI